MTGRSRVAVYAGVATLAASSSLSAVYSDYGWLLPVAAAIAIVVGIGELIRRSPLPGALAPLLSAGGVLLLLTRLYVSHDAWLGIVPTSSSLAALGDVARVGFDDVSKLAPPVPTHHGLELLAVVGVAGIALVVDLLAVTLRRAALARLPVLAAVFTRPPPPQHGAPRGAVVVATPPLPWAPPPPPPRRAGPLGAP